MLQGDVRMYRDFCANEYNEFWDDLDMNSKEFLITAHYLYDRSKAQATDFSPVIIEYCRVFENELLVKIFKIFIQSQASLSQKPTYQNRVFVKIDKAVDDQKNYGGFFLSSMDMVKILQIMNRFFNEAGYENNLNLFLRTNGYDTRQLSDRQHFIIPAKDYVDNYRNEAAHPNFLQEEMAANCHSKTKYLIRKFIGAKTNNL